MTHGNQEPAESSPNIGKNHDHRIEYVAIDKLVPYAKNAKKHTEKQVNQITASMRQFGFISPMIVDGRGEIIAGHGRWEAAKLLGLKQVPVIRVENLTPAEIKAYRLADNKLTMNTGFDETLLRIEIKDIAFLDPNFELEGMGFETAALDIMLTEDAPQQDPADDTPPVDDGPPVTKSGDLWDMDDHRLFCGDSRDIESFKRLMMAETAHMCFSDPPFNVKVDGHVCGAGKIKHAEFAMASGEMTEDEFIAFLSVVIALMIQFSRNGSLHYLFIDWRHVYELLTAGRKLYSELKNICFWNKMNGGMGSFYRSKHEMIVVFKNGTAPHLNTIELGAHGRYRTNVWDYAGVNQFGNQDDLKMHPTVKPVALIMDAISAEYAPRHDR